jgi:hypothetical protein
MFKSLIFGFSAGLALLLVSAVAGFHSQKNPLQEKKQQELAQYKAELVDATPVRLGVLTARQQVHSKQFAYYKALRNDKTISWLTRQAEGEYKIVTAIIGAGQGQVLKPDTPENYFGNLSQESDAVIRGKVTKKESQITEDESFVITDYEVTVLEVMKNNPISQVNTGTALTVTRPGGKVLLDDVIVRAIDESYKPLPLNGHEVVLFLKYIPETGAYKTTKATGSFELVDDKATPLSSKKLPPGVLQSRNSLLHTVRAVSNK